MPTPLLQLVVLLSFGEELRSFAVICSRQEARILISLMQAAIGQEVTSTSFAFLVPRVQAQADSFLLAVPTSAL